MFVLIQNGRAHQIWETAPELSAGLTVVETNDPVEIGWVWETERFIPQAEVTSDLSDVKMAAITAVDQQAELARSKFVTPGSAQAMVYLSKETEARQFLGAGQMTPADYPLLAAEIGITGGSLQEVASAVLASASTWRVAAAAIETIRLSAKKTIQEAATVASVDAAFAGLKYPEP